MVFEANSFLLSNNSLVYFNSFDNFISGFSIVKYMIQIIIDNEKFISSKSGNIFCINIIIPSITNKKYTG